MMYFCRFVIDGIVKESFYREGESAKEVKEGKEQEHLTVKCFECGKEIKVTVEEFVLADIGINPIACFKHEKDTI